MNRHRQTGGRRGIELGNDVPQTISGRTRRGNLKKLLCCLLFPFAATALSALDSGDWINTVTAEVVTPHQKWAKPLAGGPLRVLFVTDAGGSFSGKGMLAARMVAEWAQRMDMDYEVFTASSQLSLDKRKPYLAIYDDNHGRAANMYSGTQSGAKLIELEKKLEKPYELYVFNRIAFSALPVEAKKTIISHVLNGAGLVLINELKTDLPNLTRYPSESLFNEISRLSALNGDPETFAKMAASGKIVHQDNLDFSVFTQKKGRIAQIAVLPEPSIGLNGQNSIYYVPEWSAMFEALKGKNQERQRSLNEAPVPLWWGEFETLNADFLRIFHRTAGRVPKVSLTCPALKKNPVLESREQTLALSIQNPEKLSGDVTVRIRSDENKVLSEQNVKFSGESASCSIPLLPAGKYYLDLMLKTDGRVEDFGVLEFQVKSPLKLSLEMDTDLVRDGKGIVIGTNLSRPVANGKFRVTLSDSPYDRTWSVLEEKTDGSSAQKLRLDNWYLPNSAGILRVELVENGKVTAYARKMVFRPEGNKLTPWIDFLWAGSITPINGLINFGQQGWNGVTQSLSRRRGNVPNHMVMGEIVMPWGPLNSWYMTNQKNKCSSGYRLDPKTGETVPDWNDNNGASSWDATPEEQKKLDGMSPDMTERPAAVREVFRLFTRSTRLFDYGVSVVNLGDETSPGYDTYIGKYITGEFHRYLRRNFGTIEKLNRAWDRGYANFDDIPLLTTGEATVAGKLPEGAAARLFAEDNYFGVHRIIGAEIQKASAGAYYGPNSTTLPGELDYPEINASFDHPRDIASLTLRYSMKPDNLYIPLFGYSQKLDGGPNRNYWACAITGAARGHMYFSGNVTFDGGTLCADFRDKQPNVTAPRLMMQKGVGPLIRSLEICRSTMAILTSYPSWKANIFAAANTVSPVMSVNPLLTYGNENGYNFDYITPNALKKHAAQYKVLFLAGLSALSEENAKEIVEFTRSGGTVIADLNPGIYNEYLGLPAKNLLSELFGDLKPAPVDAKIRFGDITVSGVAGITPMKERKVGKGKAILMNFSLASIVAGTNSTDDFNKFMSRFLKELGLSPLLDSKGLPPGSIIRLSRGSGFHMIAFANDDLSAGGQKGGDVTVTFPKPGYIYEAMKGFIREGQTVTLPLDPPYRFLTCFDTRQQPPALRTDSASATPGKPLLLDLRPFPPNRILSLEIFDPQGRLLVPRNEIGSRLLIVPDGRKESFPVHFAYSDPKGVYKLVLTDVATGLSSSISINVK